MATKWENTIDRLEAEMKGRRGGQWWTDPETDRLLLERLKWIFREHRLEGSGRLTSARKACIARGLARADKATDDYWRKHYPNVKYLDMPTGPEILEGARRARVVRGVREDAYREEKSRISPKAPEDMTDDELLAAYEALA